MVRSLAFRTDLALLGMQGSVVEDQGDVLVVRTPSNPAYWWGNFLLFPEQPEPGESAGWLRRFAAAFPDADHVTIGIDGTDGATGDLTPMLSAGMVLDQASVLTAHDLLPPPHPHDEAACRRLTSDTDWAQTLELWIHAGLSDPTGDRAYALARLNAYRSMQERELGAWFGAFVGGELRSSLGVFAADGIARFQRVATPVEHRGQGLAGTLVHHAGRFALDELGAGTLVIVADPGNVAIRVYRSLGFVDTETQVGLERPPTGT